MKVKDLIELLEGMDEDADVYLMGQPNYPFEHGIAGVCQRGDFAGEDEDDDCEARVDRWAASDDALPKNDVFLCEGSQLRYGNKDAWDACNGAGW